ncbi:MAG TPA: fatty acyl-AMP ligase [Thermoleophilaceae bacterium]
MRIELDETTRPPGAGGSTGGAPDGLVETMRRRADLDPGALAFTFLAGDHDAQDLTRGALDREARAVAAMLQAHDVQRPLLLHAPGRDYVTALIGCLYAGTAAVPAYPPDPARLERTLPRLLAIVEDAQPGAVLTTAALKPVAEQLLRDAGPFEIPVLATDEAAASGEADWTPPEHGPERLALLQYTSGSTALPRGVMITHGNLLHNCGFINRAFGASERSRALVWLPPYHDMGLIGGIVQPLYGGFPGVLMSPVDFLRRPVRWLRAIGRYGATHSGSPNFAYELCLRRVTDEDRREIDLSTWEVAFNGAEPISAATMDSFSEAFAGCGFRREAFHPCYGLAEGTLMVTGGAKLAGPVVNRFDRRALDERGEAVPARDGDAAKTVVGCGRPDRGHTVAVVDPDTCRPRPPGTVGEIWFAGPGAAAGYWGSPEAAGDTFGFSLPESPGERFVRTGDLGFELGGELYVTGRAKEVIVVAGRNHSPVDVELACEAAAPELRPHCGAAFGLIGEDGERVGVVYEVAGGEDVDMDDVIRRMRGAVATAVGIQLQAVALIEPKTLPKTSSGKVQRLLCRSLYEEGRLETVAAWSL